MITSLNMDSMELLFFDTFAHESCDDYNLDLVQFPRPVFISELRVIPLGTKVQADFPGGVRLGATNPSQFRVDFFVNDLSKSGASTFHKLGGLDYKHNVEIQLNCPNSIPTDGLVLQGLYTTITIAIYGSLAKVTKEKVQSPPPPPPPPPAVSVKTKISTVASEVEIKQEVINDNNSHEISEKSYLQKPEAVPCSPESSPQYPIQTVPSSHIQLEYDQWIEPESRSQDYTLNSSNIDNSHKRKDDRPRSHSRESTREDRHRDAGVSSSYKDSEKNERDRDRSVRDRDKNVDDRNERDRVRERERDKDGKSSRSSRDHQEHRDHRSIRSPPMPSLRRHPPSPKERHRPRTPPTPHPETIEIINKPISPLRPPILPVITETFKDEVFEPLTPEVTLVDQMDSDDFRDTNCPDYYEEIVSDEEEMFEGEEPMEFQNELEYDLGDDAYLTAFNPFNCEISQVMYFCDPGLTEFEMDVIKNGPIDDIETEKLMQLMKEGQEKRLSERWVEILETLPTFSSQLAKVANNDFMDIIIDWVFDALNFDYALQQEQAVFKTRQIKAGIKLSSFVFEFPRKYCIKLLDRGVQIILLKLFNEDYMARSLKLLILKALDASTRFKEGMEALCIKELCSEQSDGFKSGYQMLLEILLKKPMARLTVAITPLLRKIHFYEALKMLLNSSEGISKKFAKILSLSKMEISKDSDTMLYERDSINNLGDETKAWIDSNKTDLKAIFTYLKEIHLIYSNAEHLIAQPSRSLPVKSKFCLHKNPNNPLPGIYSLLADCDFLEVLLLLLSFPPTITQPTIVWIIKEILGNLLSSQHGLLFLLSHPETTNAIIRLLLQCSDDGRDDIPYDSALQELGQQMAHYLHVLQCIDALLAEIPQGQKCREKDDPDILATLHDLYTMTFTSLGQSAVANIFGMDKNLEAIIPFIQFIGDEDYDMKLKKSSCMGYTLEILLVIMRLCETVDHLERFSGKLLSIASQDSNLKLQELTLWLAPIRKMPTFSYQDIPQLCATIKTAIDNVLTFPEELITSLRILRYLIAPAHSNNLKEGIQEDLKYKYAILQLCSNDGLACFLSILEKICDAYNYPFLHSSSFVGQKGVLLIAVIKPTIFLLNQILSLSICCRKNEFNDLTSIPILMKVHSLLSFYPAISIQANIIQNIQIDIIDILAAFTQPDVEVAESEEAALVGSLWTKMLQEVFKFISKSPSFFISSFTVLSELLPLPLPMQTHEPLSTEELSKAVNYRKFWSLHLHYLASDIQNLITVLGGSGDPNLQQIIRRLCVQLADLSASTSLVVIRGILDVILDMLDNETNEKSSQIGHLSRLLNFLSLMVSQACIKIPLLSLIKGTSKIDRKYFEFLPKIAELIAAPSLKSDKILTSPQFQECIMSIFQSLCDAEISFSGTDLQMLTLEQLANALPCKEHMGTICTALWEHLDKKYPGSPSVLVTLRTLVMLTEHDYGFYHLKTNLDKYPSALYNFLDSLCQQFVRDIPDFLSSLTTFLELLQLMVNLDDDLKFRTYNITSEELAQYLKWIKPDQKLISKDIIQSQVDSGIEPDKIGLDLEMDQDSLHPLLHLEKLLNEANREEDTLEIQALESIRDLILFLNNSTIALHSQKDKEILEITLPNGNSLKQQYSQRISYVVCDVDEDGLNTAFCLSQLGADELEQDNDNITCDLHALSLQVCPNFEFMTELEKLFLTKDDTPGIEKSRKESIELGKRKYQPIINSGNKDPIRKKPFVAPMRGRGYARGGMHSSRANDPFRSRPPNTSRPPSMHVDDFVAMEILQPTNTSAGSSLKREPNRTRGRGFDGVREFNSSRGRSFQAVPTNYNRGDDRGGCLRGNPRAASSSWGNNISGVASKSLQKFNSPISRSSFAHPGVVDPRSEARSSGGRPSNSSTRILDIQGAGGRLSRLARPNANPHGEMPSWSNIGGKSRDNRFPNSGRSNRNREANRHPRSLTSHAHTLSPNLGNTYYRNNQWE